MTESTIYPLRLSKALQEEVERVAKQDGTSMDQFINIAVAEKLAALRTAEYFRERAERVDMEAFRQVLNRAGGEPPRPGDELPE